MKLALQSTKSRALVLAASSFLVFVFLANAALQFLAARFSTREDQTGLETAVRLQPYNAEYRYRLGMYFSLLQPDKAAQSYRMAVALNPYRAAYWLALARAYGSLDEMSAQDGALTKATVMAPTDPATTWEAANTYFSRGNVEQTLNQCQKLLHDDGPSFERALPFCWRVKPDADFFLSQMLPRKAEDYESLLYFLMREEKTDASAKTWQEIIDIHNEVPRRLVFDYVHYLLVHQQTEPAFHVWQQAAPLADLAEYQPSENNLIVNGDFEERVLNGGFDWLYQKSPHVSLSLDAGQNASDGRSLFMSFDKAQIEDAGIQQLVPIHADTTYDFSADFKAKEMEGAGGVHFVIQDAYSGNVLFATKDLTDTSDWQQTSGSFTSGPNTTLLIVRLQRLPAGDVIKGKLWIDGVRLMERRMEQP
jgi:tetratricopeptide (TPR) repeat protein